MKRDQFLILACSILLHLELVWTPIMQATALTWLLKWGSVSIYMVNPIKVDSLTILTCSRYELLLNYIFYESKLFWNCVNSHSCVHDSILYKTEGSCLFGSHSLEGGQAPVAICHLTPSPCDIHSSICINTLSWHQVATIHC